MAALSLFCFGLFVVPSALASYEQVGNFAGTPGALKLEGANSIPAGELWPEEVQLGGVGGMAVNYTGAGGVSAGTLYAFGGSFSSGGEERVARFNPNGSFSEAWTFDSGPFSKRCGPEGLPAEPTCKKQLGGGARNVDVDVDQSTGYVYALRESTLNAGIDLIHVYSADGSKVIAEFGVQAAGGETIAQSPEKIHETLLQGGIAVDATGDVFVYDQNPDQSKPRLMEFVPSSPGDYEHYVYAGQGHDLTWENGSRRPSRPVADAAGHIYVGEGGDIAEFDPSNPGAGPVCEYSSPSASIEAITVDPLNGEVFYSDFHDQRVHQLAACDAEGKFVEVSKTAPLSPSRQEVSALAFDPVRHFASGRPPGVLYLGAPSSGGGNRRGEEGESSLGYVFARPLELLPVVGGVSASHVASGSGLLSGTVNPEGSLTRYAFQYVTQAEYEANEATDPFTGAVETPLGGGVVGEGKGAVSVSAGLSGLVADTEYRYRLVATSNCSVEEPEKVCETESETGRFHTFAVTEAGVLPDGRVYELVSPPQKYGGQVFPADPRVGSCDGCKPGRDTGASFPRQASIDGGSVVYSGSPFTVNDGSVLSDEYVARRDPVVGWQSVNLTPTLLATAGNEGYEAFSDDLSRGVFEQRGVALSGEAPGEYSDLYSQPSGDPGDLTSLLSGGPPNRPAGGVGDFQVRYAGASSDLSRVFFEANDALTEEVAGVAPAAVDGGPGKFNLYEWHEGRLALVNVLPGNTATQPGDRFGAPDAHAVSDDGSRVFFSDETGQVYVREKGLSTREIQTEGVPDPAPFLAGSADGSAVLLADGHLHGLDGGEPTVDLTQGKGGFLGLVGQSEDLTHVYFVDTSVLSGEEENENCTILAGKKSCEQATEGKDNLYSWTQTTGTRFVATLANFDDEGAAGAANGAPGDWAREPFLRTAQASPDGRFVAFESTARLTGYDNTGLCEINHEGGFVNAPCIEVFLYDSETGRLTCASCDRSGVRPLGYSTLRRVEGPSTLPVPRYLSDQGRLFFDSEDSLVPADTNAGVEDVYEYEPESVGTCNEGVGCVSLISGGTGRFDSNFLASDANGANVFFTTVDRLSSRDGDELVDLYDARVNGGLADEQGSLEVECHGETCQPPSPSMVGVAPASFTFQGAGNAPPPGPSVKATTRKTTVKRCAAGKKRVKGRCVKKHRARKASAHRSVVRRNRGGVK